MATIARCDHCQAAFKIKDHLVGKAIRCPNCNQAFRVQFAARAQSSGPVDNTPVAPQVTHSNTEDFFRQPEDPDAYAKNVARAKRISNQRKLTTLGVIAGIAALVIAGGAYFAIRQTYERTIVELAPIEADPFRTEQLALQWQPKSMPVWNCRFMESGGEVDEQTDRFTYSSDDPMHGYFFLEVRAEDNARWNEFLASIDRRNIYEFVPDQNLAKIRKLSVSTANRTQVHRFELTSIDHRIAKEMAVVRKFSTDGKTFTLLWYGLPSRASWPDVQYFFTNFAYDGKRFIRN